MQLFPSCTHGMWTNSQEEFLFEATETKFGVGFLPVAAWDRYG